MAGKWTEIEIKDERPIGNNTDFKGFHTAEKPIVHYLLTARQVSHEGVPKNPLVFDAQKQDSKITDASLKDVIKYSEKLYSKGSNARPPLNPTPLDMGVSQQCWLVIELDKNINWHYARGSRACTSKHGDPDHPGGKGHNIWLRHVYENGATLEKTNEIDVGKDGCRVLFFGVAHRGHEDYGTDPHHSFNLKIEFYQNTSGRDLVLPVVLDPDVGNDGHEEIPPP